MASDRDIIESVGARNIRCDSCGDPNPTWNVQDSVNVLPEVVNGDIDLSSGIPVRAVVCGSCGYMRLYSTQISQ